jgi:rod shape determining protein RodA
MIDRSTFSEIDWYMVALVLLNAALGCLMIYSGTHDLPGHVYLKQVFWVAVSCFAFFIVLLVDYKVLVTYSPVLYLLGLGFLAGLMATGRLIGGARSWFRLAFIGVQPSELMKAVLILVLARLFAEFKRPYVTLSKAALAVGLTGLPMALVALQPDLGTAATYLPLLLAALLLAGLNRRTLVVLLAAALVLGFLGWSFGLKDYQKKRVETLFSPGLDPRGSGYQINQSKIAVGSGGFLGKGFKKGTQSQLRFLPARHTDFVFSVVGEEFGFLGVAVALTLYLLLLLRLFRTTAKSRDRSGIYIVFLVASLLTFQFLVNVFMVVGLFPVTGIPLPLLSYGGSSLLAAFVALGLVANVRMRRFANV